MTEITKRSWELLHEIRTELKLDKPPPVDIEEVVIHNRARPPGSARRKIDTRPAYTPRKQTADEKIRPNEVTMKDFITDECAKTGCSRNSIWHRIKFGMYGITLRRVNPRLVFVTRTGPDKLDDLKPREGEITMKDWVQSLATAEGVSLNCIYTRIQRGTLIVPNKRVVNGRVVFVKP